MEKKGETADLLGFPTHPSVVDPNQYRVLFFFRISIPIFGHLKNLIFQYIRYITDFTSIGYRAGSYHIVKVGQR